jgi:hypothetical protein
MPRIRSLKPNVTREEAVAVFSAGGFSTRWRDAAFGPLRSVADFYIPFRLFQVKIVNRGKEENRILGQDVVNGSLDLYHFPELPSPGELIYRETRNCPPALLADELAQQMIVAKVQRFVFTAGFFRVRNLRITAEPVAGEIFVPYWAGFRGRDSRANLEVLDAIRRRMEGAKVRRLLHSWLTSAQ